MWAEGITQVGINKKFIRYTKVNTSAPTWSAVKFKLAVFTVNIHALGMLSDL